MTSFFYALKVQEIAEYSCILGEKWTLCGHALKVQEIAEHSWTHGFKSDIIFNVFNVFRMPGWPGWVCGPVARSGGPVARSVGPVARWSGALVGGQRPILIRKCGMMGIQLDPGGPVVPWPVGPVARWPGGSHEATYRSLVTLPNPPVF